MFVSLRIVAGGRRTVLKTLVELLVHVVEGISVLAEELLASQYRLLPAVN